MARNRSVLNKLQKIKRDTAPAKYPVSGFTFEMDQNPQDAEDALQSILPLEEGMPRVKGFLYEFEGVLYGETSDFA